VVPSAHARQAALMSISAGLSVLHHGICHGADSQQELSEQHVCVCVCVCVRVGPSMSSLTALN
jgi:hypothetical protein